MKKIILKIILGCCAGGVLAGVGFLVYWYDSTGGSSALSYSDDISISSLDQSSSSIAISAPDTDGVNSEDLAVQAVAVKPVRVTHQKLGSVSSTSAVAASPVASVVNPTEITKSNNSYVASTSTVSVTVLPKTLLPPPAFTVSISSMGNGSGIVSSSPSGILCGFTCRSDYVSGAKIIFTATPAAGSSFKGWSGPCSGVGQCAVVVSSSISLAADFELVPVAAPVVPLVVTPTIAVPTPTSSEDEDASAQSVGHPVIAQIQIGGASSTNDFIKIFNPGNVTVDMSGWKLHKKSGTGTDYSLRTFGTGSTIAPGGYFTWANAAGGFADSIGANISSTETLSADNSVALFDANGTIVDAVAWGTGTNQYVEGVAYPTDPTAGQVLTRRTAGTTIVDTDNNAADFTIQ